MLAQLRQVTDDPVERRQYAGVSQVDVCQIEVGLVRINGDTTGVDPHAPFGGMKGSSSGSREQGTAAREFYTETKTVTSRWFDGDVPVAGGPNLTISLK